MPVEVLEVKPVHEGCILAFVKVSINGVVIDGCKFIKSKDSPSTRWVIPPDREYKKRDGTRAWARIVEWPREWNDKIKQAVEQAYEAGQPDQGMPQCRPR